MGIAIQAAGGFVVPLATRQPFGFGDTTVERLPHVFVSVETTVDGERAAGIAADHAIPKWFVKDPAKTARDDVEDILTTVERACAAAVALEDAPTPFDAWRRLYDRLQSWAADTGHPPLLATFGASFVERALVDAYCRVRGTSFGAAIRGGELGLRLDALHPELSGRDPDELLPSTPRRSVAIRHTVGLADPLTDADRSPADRVDDGLPETLAGAIEADGVHYVKCKVSGNADADATRLARIAGVLDERLDDYAVTLDANEQYRDSDPFRELWTALTADSRLDAFLDNLICVEQPFDREVALTAATGEALTGWPDRPPLVIDESDGRLESCRRALDRGYAGTSYKSAKGVFKGVANACLLEHRRRESDGRRYLLTAEDLTTIGPVALPQDLAAVATLGLEHAERNGHHYFRGLSAFPDDVQAAVLEAHGDLYRRHEAGFPTLAIEDGQVALDSVVAAPFGVGLDLDASRFTPIAAWNPDSLGL